VLTEAAISGRIDYLRGLKENVIMGRLIPPAPAWNTTATSTSSGMRPSANLSGRDRRAAGDSRHGIADARAARGRAGDGPESEAEEQEDELEVAEVEDE